MKMKKQRRLRKTALLMAVLILTETLLPPVAMALTSGPTQPEFQGFQQVGTSNMVDLFTGDFNYNIPLCEVGGYPINLVYNADPKMDDEASWVGLGWSLNPGAINRQMRGLPDDFKGDTIKKSFNIRKDETIGVTLGASAELLGGQLGLDISRGITYNNRRGFEFSRALNASLLGKPGSRFTANMGLSFAPSKGLSINTAVGLSAALSQNLSLQNNLSAGANSRRGLSALTFQSTFGKTGIGVNFSHGKFDYIPTSLLPLNNISFLFHSTIGTELWTLNPNVKVDGYYSKQELATDTEEQMAYGYLHLEEGRPKSKALLDYNSELKGSFKLNTPYLPIAYGTPDNYSFSAHGTGGQFKAVRGDLGILRPAKEETRGISPSLGAEFGPGGYVKGGIDITVTKTNNTKKEWDRTENRMRSNLLFGKNENLHEAVFFKSMGEQVNGVDAGLYDQLGGGDPIRINNLSEPSRLLAGSSFIQRTNTGRKTIYPNGKLQNTKRVKRNRAISFLTNKDLEHYLPFRHFSIQEDNCPHNIVLSNGQAKCECEENTQFIARNSRPENHIAQFTVTESDGMRYEYGLPVYNNYQKDVTFSIDESAIHKDLSNVDKSNYGLVAYRTDIDNSIANRNGDDHYYDATEMPPYAHSHLLTRIKTPDFQDGSSLGFPAWDFLKGNSVSFKYHLHNPNYKWRIPVQQDTAKYQEGLKATLGDDKASYIYGEKELWYVYSIESISTVARFYSSPREDGLGVKGENGGADEAQTTLKLDSIALFSKADLNSNGESAIPIKKVHFEYNYELCKGVPNQKISGQGKLTLKKIYFTYGNSQSGKLNAYHFNYNIGVGQDEFNYNIGQYNRWGFLQKNPTLYPPNHEYPYNFQSGSALSEQPIGAWNLNEITLPSGGKIAVEYEQDDYAWVQDRRAGQMMKIKGFSGGDLNRENIFYKDDDDNITQKEYVIVEMPMPVKNLEEAKRRYLEEIEQVYFNCLIKLKRNDKEERVIGYFRINKNKAIEVSNYDALKNEYSELLLPLEMLEDNKNRPVNPFTFAALQKTRLELPEIIYPGYKEKDLGVAFLTSIAGYLQEIGNFFKGFEYNAMKKGFGKKIVVDDNASWLRLYSPNYKKNGGGTRVKRLIVSDEWSYGNKSTYGQSYDYTQEMTVNGKTETISSGVAAYEPGIGGEENMLKNPIPYDEKMFLAPKKLYYSEKPIGEALYPGPHIGYSKVTVTDIANEESQLIRNKSGYTIHQFYTAKDFPVFIKKTKIQPKPVFANPVNQALKLNVYHGHSVAQGFTIELNDMHGKAKGQAIYDKDHTLLSNTNYYYKVDDEKSPQKRLLNEVPIIKPDNSISTAQLGVEMETWTEMMEETNSVVTAGGASNIDVFPALFGLPFGLGSVYAKFQTEKKQFRSASITKCVQKNGILDRVEVMENGSTISTHNELFDSETGTVLLTRTVNEFDDEMYDLKYPAHWMYPKTGQAYENIGAIFTNIDLYNGIIPFDIQHFFKAGDEVLLEDESGVHLAYKTVVEHNDNFVVIEGDGQISSGAKTYKSIKVIRSGKRNQLNSYVGQITSQKSPITNLGQIMPSKNTAILTAAATTLTQKGKMQCNTILSNDNTGSAVFFHGNIRFNPYEEGVLGTWRPHENYVYYSHRNSESPLNAEVAHIRNTGFFNDFSPFWNFTNNKWQPATSLSNKWTLANAVTKYDIRGNELENLDALGIYSSAYFGFNKMKATAIANNAQFQEIYFDSFEDYTYDPNCLPVGFGEDLYYRRSLDFISNGIAPEGFATVSSLKIAHSGKHSMSFLANEKKEFSLKLKETCIEQPDDLNFPIANQCEDCLPVLTPFVGKDYNMAIWAASTNSLAYGVTPKDDYKIEIFYRDGNEQLLSDLTQTLAPKGPVIEGWQQMEEKVTIPENAAYLILRLSNLSNEKIYFDDFRFHPWLSNMQSYVYDPFSERLMATLDENNYASFYEYNDEGILIRTKRETEKGIVTIQEGRTILKPNN